MFQKINYKLKMITETPNLVLNQISQNYQLKTQTCQQLFSQSSEEQVQDLIMKMMEELEKSEFSDSAIYPAINLYPLIAESEALTAFLEENPELNLAITPVPDLASLGYLARQEYRLSPSQEQEMLNLIALMAAKDNLKIS